MMLKTFALAAALVLGTVIPASAESMCSEPIAPAALDGSTATQAQLLAAKTDVLTFLKQSDDYQDCIIKELKDAKDAALKAKKDLDPTLAPAVDAKVKSNQALKEKVGAEFNAAAIAYNAKHPGK